MSTKKVQVQPAAVLMFQLLLVGAWSFSGVMPAEAETIRLEGSSTVEPIAAAVAEEYGSKNPAQKITVGASGTGGGFKKFCASEIDIANASRPIKKSEDENCRASGVDYIELPVAFDAISVVVHPKNTWAETMTVAELKKLWEPEAQQKITKWNQIRADWPDKPISLFGPGVDSGTYDYFTQAIVGKEHSSRGDYTSSEDDNVIVQGVSGDTNALGFLGLSYFTENTSKLKAVKIDDGNDSNGKGPQIPSKETVVNGTYQPLSRPLFIYVSTKAATRPEVAEFVSYFMKNVGQLSSEVGYVALPDNAYMRAMPRFEKRMTGSLFGTHGSQAGLTIESVLAKESLN